MRCESWLRLLCASLLATLYACGQITHDIGRIRTDTQEFDGSSVSTPIDEIDTGRIGDSGIVGADSTVVPQQIDASYDGNLDDVKISLDAALADGKANGEIDGNSAIDASTDAPDDAIDNECFEETIDIEVANLGLDIYIMMDALQFSGFWNLPTLTSDQITMWSEVQDEISAFVDDPDSEGIGVGIQYYGRIELDGDPLITTYCDVSNYKEPAVSIADLPGNAEEIKASFPTISLATSPVVPPVVPALQGAIAQAKSRVPDNPGRKQIVFLITGTGGIFDPFCGSNIQYLINTAEQGYAGNPSIATYVIGIYRLDIDYSPMIDDLGDVARHGGTLRPYLASLSRPVPELARKLGEARDAAKLTAKACGIDLPQEFQGRLPATVDLDLTSIFVTTSDSQTMELKAVRDHSSCTSGELGWHFDDPTNPSSIVACEQTCERLNSESIDQAKLRINCPN